MPTLLGVAPSENVEATAVRDVMLRTLFDDG